MVPSSNVPAKGLDCQAIGAATDMVAPSYPKKPNDSWTYCSNFEQSLKYFINYLDI